MGSMKNAVVIGSGVAGLASAAAISPFFKKVTVLDKDTRAVASGEFPSGIRKSVPQGAHIHILLKAGLERLESILPGIASRLESRGSVRICCGTEQQIYEYGGWMPCRDLGMYFLSQSRPLLESVVYECVDEIGNVDIKQNSRVVGMDFANCSDRPKSTVFLKDGSEISADVIVDAAGNGAPFLRLMNEKLSENIPIEESPINLFYATLYFRKKALWQGKQENILVNPEPGVSNFGGSLISIEDESWCVSLHGANGEKPPKDKDEWMAMVSTLANDRIWNRIQGADIVSDLKIYKKATSIFRRFDLVEGLPKSYFPIGDTITSFNPIYGQGMTVALGHVIALKNSLSGNVEELHQIHSEYLKNSIEVSRPAWDRAALFDEQGKILSRKVGRVDTLRKITKAKHKRAEAEIDYHLELAKKVHMLT
ncbi:FAD-dependent oxidoreductase [Microbulbifer sp. SA54]|uniref:FAD-dependent oxidoreductase n=1 Tax=Microbulbifer sp. SA54 TaxID=3401577 RepID=UPI003AB0B613